MTNKIRLLIADDHEVVRSGLKNMLADSEMKVIGEAGNGRRPSSSRWRTRWMSCCWTSACRTATG